MTEVGRGLLVSVIMNCHNGERWLREAIDSVYGQTYPDWEIVFWDNASTDSSAEIARGYDARLHYSSSEEMVPLGAARNLAVREARGEMIAFLDCDDVWFPFTLERLVALIGSGEYAAVYGGFVTIDERGRELARYVPHHRSGYLLDHLLRKWDIGVLTFLVRKAALDAPGLSFDPQLTTAEDYCLFMQLAVDQPFAVLNDVVAKYRIHEGSLTNRSIARWCEEREYTLDLVCARHPGIQERHSAAFDEAYARARYYRARYYMARGEKRKAKEEMRQICFANHAYLALYLLLQLPASLWNWVHRIRTRRAGFSWGCE